MPLGKAYYGQIKQILVFCVYIPECILKDNTYPPVLGYGLAL